MTLEKYTEEVRQVFLKNGYLNSVNTDKYFKEKSTIDFIKSEFDAYNNGNYAEIHTPAACAASLDLMY